jgi:hypothetical protein
MRSPQDDSHDTAATQHEEPTVETQRPGTTMLPNTPSCHAIVFNVAGVGYQMWAALGDGDPEEQPLGVTTSRVSATALAVHRELDVAVRRCAGKWAVAAAQRAPDRPVVAWGYLDAEARDDMGRAGLVCIHTIEVDAGQLMISAQTCANFLNNLFLTLQTQFVSIVSGSLEPNETMAEWIVAWNTALEARRVSQSDGCHTRFEETLQELSTVAEDWMVVPLGPGADAHFRVRRENRADEPEAKPDVVVPEIAATPVRLSNAETVSRIRSQSPPRSPPPAPIESPSTPVRWVLPTLALVMLLAGVVLWRSHVETRHAQQLPALTPAADAATMASPAVRDDVVDAAVVVSQVDATPPTMHVPPGTEHDDAAAGTRSDTSDFNGMHGPDRRHHQHGNIAF